MKVLIRHTLMALAFALPQMGCFSVLTDLNLTPDAPITGSERSQESRLSDKDAAEACVALAADLEKAGHYADAIVEFEQARKLEPKKYKHVCRRLAVLYDRMGDERKALDEYSQALKRTPKDADLLNDVGYCHYNRGRWSEAEGYFRKALAVNPQHPRACTNLGLALAQQGKHDEAMKAFQVTLRPAEAKANIAFVLAAQGKREEARIAYEAALELDPGLVTAQQGLSALEKGPATKNEAVQAASNRSKAAAKAKAALLGEREPESTQDQSPFIVDPRTIGKIK